MALLYFLIQVFVISFSGAMQPGPVTAAVVTMGARNRYAGSLLAVGHGIIEFPLMVLVILGMGKFFESEKAQVTIGLAGGVFLLMMAIQMIIGLQKSGELQEMPVTDKPVLAGIILSAGNPYFLVWWATVGLALATKARDFGVWAFALFGLVHWSVDLIWLQILSWTTFKGTTLLGPRRQRIVLLVCALSVLCFGVLFIGGAAAKLLALL